MTTCPLPRNELFFNIKHLINTMKTRFILAALAAALLCSSCQEQDMQELRGLFDQGLPAKPFNPHRAVS